MRCGAVAAIVDGCLRLGFGYQRGTFGLNGLAMVPAINRFNASKSGRALAQESFHYLSPVFDSEVHVLRLARPMDRDLSVWRA